MKDIDRFLQEHNWPPGNSQTLISVFTGQEKIVRKCHCGEKAIGEAVATNGWQGFLCEAHYEQSRDARLLKKWKVI